MGGWFQRKRNETYGASPWVVEGELRPSNLDGHLPAYRFSCIFQLKTHRLRAAEGGWRFARSVRRVGPFRKDLLSPLPSLRGKTAPTRGFQPRLGIDTCSLRISMGRCCTYLVRIGSSRFSTWRSSKHATCGQIRVISPILIALYLPMAAYGPT